MELIIGYLIFAVATAIAVHLYLISPVIREALSNLDKDDMLNRHQGLTHIVFFITNTIIAPVMLIIYLSESKTQQFKVNLLKALTSKN